VNWNFVDSKFKQYKSHFFLQPLLAGFFVILILAALGGFQHVDLLGYLGSGALGSSAFLVFTSPNCAAASIRRMWGGYAISIIIGVFFSGILYYLMQEHVNLTLCYCAEIAAALAIAFIMFLMALFGLEHPPAVGLALGLVVEPWTRYTLLVMVLSIVLLTAVKHLLRNWLIDLIKSN
jgi:CBS-domain-containing membrane protein